MACCGSPSPRILEKNSRLFCGNCKRYLDQAPEPPPVPEPDDVQEEEPSLVEEKETT